MRKTSLNELRKIVAELNTIKSAYELDLKCAIEAIEWINTLNKKLILP